MTAEQAASNWLRSAESDVKNPSSSTHSAFAVCTLHYAVCSYMAAKQRCIRQIRAHGMGTVHCSIYLLHFSVSLEDTL